MSRFTAGGLVPVPAGSSGPSTPTLIQAFVSTGNSVASNTDAVNNVKFTAPFTFSAGNCLVLKLTLDNAASVSSISDTVNGSWSTTPAVHANAGAGANDTYVFLFPNTAAGKATFTLVFSTTVQIAMWTLEEWAGIATSSPLNASAQQANQTNAGSGINSGSLTPGNGNLVLTFAEFSGGGSSTANPTSWTAGSGFTLHDADIAWDNNQGLPKGSQYQIASTAGTVTPTITPTGDTTNPYNVVSVALKASAGAGTVPGRGIRIVKFIEQFNAVEAGTTWKVQFPTTGNLRVLASSINQTTVPFTSVTDSEGNTWTNESPVGQDTPQLFFFPGATANPNLTVTCHFSAAPNQQVHCALYDIVGAAASPLGATGFKNDTSANGLTSVPDQPDITPQATGSLIIAQLDIGQGPCTGLTSPAGAYLDSVTYPLASDAMCYSSGDGWGHLYTTSTAAENWTWSITLRTTNTVTSLAVEFKAA